MSLSSIKGIFTLICPLDRPGLPFPFASLWPEHKDSSCLVSSKIFTLFFLSPQSLLRCQASKSFCMWVFHCPQHFLETRQMLPCTAVQVPGYLACHTASCSMQLGKKQQRFLPQILFITHGSYWMLPIRYWDPENAAARVMYTALAPHLEACRQREAAAAACARNL